MVQKSLLDTNTRAFNHDSDAETSAEARFVFFFGDASMSSSLSSRVDKRASSAFNAATKPELGAATCRTARTRARASSAL